MKPKSRRETDANKLVAYITITVACVMHRDTGPREANDLAVDLRGDFQECVKMYMDVGPVERMVGDAKATLMVRRLK